VPSNLSISARLGYNVAAGAAFGPEVELTMGQWFMSHGSNGWSHGSWVSIRDPLTHDRISNDLVNQISRKIVNQ